MRRAKPDVDQELEEKFLVIEANAIVDPRAVVVHSGDASLANRAVMTLWRFHGIALLTFLRED